MKSGKWIFVCVLAVSGICFAQSGKTDDHKTVSQIEDQIGRASCRERV